MKQHPISGLNNSSRSISNNNKNLRASQQQQGGENDSYNLNRSGFSAHLGGANIVRGGASLSSSGRNNLSSYFEVDDDEEEDLLNNSTTTPQQQNNEKMMEENLEIGSLNTSQITSTASNYSNYPPLANNSFSTNPPLVESLKNSKKAASHQQHDKILKHFYQESDEESIPEPRVYSPQQQKQQHSSPQAPLSQTRSVSSKTSSKKSSSNKHNPMLEHQPPQPFPMFPNPYQFFPNFNYYPFFPPQYGANMNADAITEMQKLYPNVQASNDTFITEKSVESSSFFEKDQLLDVLISESKQMKSVIEHQSELINVILKKLDEVNGKLDVLKAQNRDKTNQVSNTNSPNTASLKSSTRSTSKQPIDETDLNNHSKTSNSMINNTSHYQFHTDNSILKKSPPASPVKPATATVSNSTESFRYANSIPSPSNSPIKPISKIRALTIQGYQPTHLPIYMAILVHL
ncbi:predicted protein [Naegleria gruberi]|uniref:Predicted protein n=1 Tax=Naegleria gruberi TaxID=5762 RepID=D2UZB8_NAEGR|nr:uncharacterized protein NAEGRDRAFT_61881 [Naegleria gruberi]EFC49920.1 predicted protein [Naegleria gruberi]|eukprot:XP_002682664.1 predicted protein [Naegleria gruberi strain NEG-M]